MFDAGLLGVLITIVICYGFPLFYSAVPVALVAWGGARLVRAVWRRSSRLVVVCAAAAVYGLLWGGVLMYALDVLTEEPGSLGSPGYQAHLARNEARARWMGASGAGAGLTLGVFTALVLVRGRPAGGSDAPGSVRAP